MMATMRRRPSSPYANITGMFVVGFLGLLILLSVVLPNGPTIVENVAAQGASAPAVTTILIATPTAGLPILAGENAAPTANPEFVLGEIVALTTTPDTNWIQMPPTEVPIPPPAPVIAEAAPPPAPVIQYVEVPVIQEVPVPVVQEVVVTAQPADPLPPGRPEIPPPDKQRPETTIVKRPTEAPEVPRPPEHNPEVIASSDFVAPDPNDKCLFVGCLP